MTDKAVISGTYSDFKIIRSRKVAQLIIEVPIEQAQALITALGLPNPAEETWVAVARLKPQTPAKEERPPTASPVDPGGIVYVDRPGDLSTVRPHRRFEDLPLPQQAALACQDMEFRDFVRQYYENDLKDEKDAAFFVREWCDVESRSEIKPHTKPGEKWGRLYNRFMLWKSAKAA